jgi:DNA-binding transcriptional LysR family regulator
VDVTKLPLLATLEVLLREQSVRETARVLGVAPSTVSRHLGQLRTLVGDSLFVRSGNVMMPTDRARALSAELTPRILELGRLLTNAPQFEPTTARIRFVVAVADAVMPTFVPALLERFAAEAPQVTLQLVSTSMPTEGLAQSVTTGAIDLYLGPPIGLTDGVVRKKLFDAGFVCVARKEHPGIGETLDLDTYCRLRHILVSSRFPAKSWVDEALEQMGRSRRVVLTAPYFLGAAHLAARTDLVATLPERPAVALARALDLQLFAMPFELPQVPFFMQWHDRQRDAPAHAWLRAAVESAVHRTHGDAGA